jgi:hypothetical protein
VSSQFSTTQRQRDPLFFSIEQQTSDFFFEQFDCSAERWLRYTTALGRTHKITLFTEGEKIPNLMHLHDTPPKAARASSLRGSRHRHDSASMYRRCAKDHKSWIFIRRLHGQKISVASTSQEKLDFPPRHDVRFTPESRHVRCASPCPLWANSAHRILPQGPTFVV